jgi:uncharacterized protein YkwD
MRSLPCLPALALLAALSLGRATAEDKKDTPRFQMSGQEKELLEMTNKERAREKLPPLKPNPVLFKAARAHSANMAKQGKMEHVLDGKNPAQRVRDLGYDYAKAAENIGVGENVPMTEIMKGWMASKHHRENILEGKYTEVGLGIARNGKGEVYYTQVFGAPRKKSQ